MLKIGTIFLMVLLIYSIFLPTTYPLGLASPETLTVTGRWQYWDNNENIRPLVWARVLIYDLEPGDVLDYKGYATTDTNGYFTSAPIPNDDGPGEDGLDIVVCITAWNPGIAVVIDPAGYTYAGLTSVYNDCPDGTLNIGTWRVPHNVRGGWMIFSYHNGLVAGWNYIQTQTDYEMAMSTARWPYEAWPHYHPGGEIHLPDWAAWYPDIILHEYAHHVMYTLYDYLPPTLPEHYINETSDASTAWAEGWANFFPLAVQNDPVLTGWNLETPHWCSPNWDDGDEVEGRVAGALWDIYDSTNDDYDTFSDGFLNIWDVIHAQSDNNFYEFWVAWIERGHAKQPSIFAIFQNSIDYRGEGDVDGNGVVDIRDITAISMRVGTEKTVPHWPDQHLDLNYDDKIDIIDVNIAASHFGDRYFYKDC